VEVTLDGFTGAQSAGILMAQERGFFAEAGLNVWVGSPVLPSRPVTYVVTGTDEFGIAQQPQVMIAKGNGVPVLAVGSLVPRSETAMIWLKRSGIGGIADLRGKTIATTGVPYQDGLLEAILARANLKLSDVTIRRVGDALVGALLSGRADAIFGAANLEGAALEARGAKPVIALARDLGIPPFEESVLVAKDDFVANHGPLVEDFLEAVARGTVAAAEDPKAAAEAIEASNYHDPEATTRTTTAELRATLPLLSRSGHMDSGQAQELIDWMREEGVVQGEFPASAALTNAYLP
jgi:putative hydroxymethylpyrimidine transport system substrate-binding protein